MSKRLLAIIVMCALIITTFSGCSNSETNSGKTESGNAKQMKAPKTDGWDSSKKIYFYSWNSDFGDRMEYVLKAHPEYRDYCEVVNCNLDSGTDDRYKQAIQNAIKSGDKYPSIITADDDVARMYIEDEDLTIPLSSVGLTKEMYANAYPYNVSYDTYREELKAMTWQATPGCFCYRSSIAKKVLGTDKPEEVAKYVSDWDKFFETAAKMKESNIKMLSGPDDVKHAVLDQRKQPWLKVNPNGSKTFQSDESVVDYFQIAKKMYDGKYTSNTKMWDDSWYENMNKDVFGYFGCTWFVYWCLGGKNDKNSASYGDWRVCHGPVDYHWGGTHIVITKDCPNKELAAYLIYSLCCDEDIMYDIAKNTFDFVNNRTVVAKQIENGDGACDVLGGQNPIELWSKDAERIDLSNLSSLDYDFKNMIDVASEGYNKGRYKTLEESILCVKDSVKKKFNNIKVD